MTKNWNNQSLNPALKFKTVNYNKNQKAKIQREHMVNRVSSSFPKGGHSATQTELNILYTASTAKHHPNIISETCFIYDFLQKDNQFVIFCFPSVPNVILHFCSSSTVSCIHPPPFFFFWGGGRYTIKSDIADPKLLPLNSY